MAMTNTLQSENLSHLGIDNPSAIFTDIAPALLVEASLSRNEANLAENGALVALTGTRTGRSPKDKFIVRDAITESTVGWGAVNQPMQVDKFDRLWKRACDSVAGRDLFVQNASVIADPTLTIGVKVITTQAWQALFARNLFREPVETPVERQWTVFAVPELLLDPASDGTRSETVIAADFSRRRILIAGSKYAGEIKKSIFTVANYLLPDQSVMPMHCAANLDKQGHTALFFGLSGTGKTTLSADPMLQLIGDDEHGWSERGVFNIEGGCYAKTINLSQAGEPQIWDAIKFGTVLENVVLDPQSRRPDYTSQKYTENTRAAYPLEYNPAVVTGGQGGQPRHIFFLSCDAFGVLPPVARLNAKAAIDWFLRGYTAKLAGTEGGVTTPEVTFSSCFGAPFLPRPAAVYGKMLQERLERYNIPVWLINTGWTGGPVGVGKRFPLSVTRALIRAVLANELDPIEFRIDPIFGLSVPISCPGVPATMLDPATTWGNRDLYNQSAQELHERWLHALDGK